MDGYGLTPLDGGFSGETFRGDAGGERTVVRVYAGRGARRGADAVLIDAAVLSLVRGLVPVPLVLEVRRPTAEQPAVLVTSYLPGERLDLLLADLGVETRAAVGTSLGRILGRLATIPMPRVGQFVDADLTVESFDLDLVNWVDDHPPAWPEGELAPLREVADHAREQLNRVERISLVHSDFNPKNLLVDRRTGEVTGVLDWEFAHAGCPVSDLGNLLRFERDPLFTDAVLTEYARIVPDEWPDLLGAARAADLVALVDLASRRGENPVTEKADVLLRAIAHSSDLHAWPFDAP
ncbi:MAG: phosphotransferase [Nocardioidaceae bacterium]